MPEFQSNKSAPDETKIRGGYYTPRSLARYLCRWAIRDESDRVLEPSCGDGSFVSAAAEMLNAEGLITAVEIVPNELDRAKRSLVEKPVQKEWVCASFFDVAHKLIKQPSYDAVVGNPPFIRFQYFDKKEREQAFQLVRSYGYRPNGLANAWVAFIQISTELLRDGGRLAMVVPAELLQVKYAEELRFRLPMLFDDIYLIGFDELVFPKIQQEVILLLADGRHRHSQAKGRIHTMHATNGTGLIGQPKLSDIVSHLPERHTHAEMKWTSLFLEDEEFQLLKHCAEDPRINRLGQLADVDVGIVTGRNSFFVIHADHAEQLGDNTPTVNVVGRTSALRSLHFTKADFSEFAASHPCKLLDLTGASSVSFSTQLDAYIRQGEAAGVNLGYKCRIRKRWFDVPSVHIPDALLFRQIHHAPLMVENLAQVTTTDTIHRVRIYKGINAGALCASLVNSLSFAWAEVIGRSYGGGVLELEPNEAEGLLVPYQFADRLDLDWIDQCLRSGNLHAALEHSDDILLKQGLGLSNSDIELAKSGWIRLQSRRWRRKTLSREARAA